MKDWMGNNKSAYTCNGASNHSLTDRQVDDYYATHPSTIDALFSVEDFRKLIWEPACGEGHLSRRMEDLGKTVISTDLIDRGFGKSGIDFLKETHGGDLYYDIITNPPYKYAQEFVEQAIKLTSGKVAMFLKLTFMEGQKRKNLFEKHPPSRIYVFSKRQQCAKNGKFENYDSNAIAYAWYVWEKEFNGNTVIKWI